MTAREVSARLSSTRELVCDELRRADGKATTLLSLVGAALAGVVALSTRSVPVPAAGLLWAAMLPIGVAVVLLLSAIRPRLGPEPMPGTWPHAAVVGPASLLESYGEDEDLVQSAAEVCWMARIARAKYRRITVAVRLLVAGLVALAGSLVLGAVIA